MGEPSEDHDKKKRPADIEKDAEEEVKFIPDSKEDVQDVKQDREKRTASVRNSRTLLIGVTITFMVCVFDATSIACLQLMTELPPDIQINAVIFGFGFLCVGPYFLARRRLPRFTRSHVPWVIGICVVFLVDCLTLYNHEASFLPLGSIGSIGYAFNILFSVILSKIFLTEVVTFRKGLALCVTLLGLVLTVLAHVPELGTQRQGKLSPATVDVSNGTVLLPSDNGTNGIYATESLNGTNFTLRDVTGPGASGAEPTPRKSFWSQLLSMALLCVSCFCSALETVMLSGSPLKNDKSCVLAFWIFFSGCVVLFPATFIFEAPILPRSWTDRTFLLTYSMCAASLSFCYITAAQLLMPMFLTIIESFGVPLMFVVQMLFLTQIAKPENIWLQLVGVVLVFCATVALPVIEYTTMKKQEKLKRHSELELTTKDA